MPRGVAKAKDGNVGKKDKGDGKVVVVGKRSRKMRGGGENFKKYCEDFVNDKKGKFDEAKRLVKSMFNNLYYAIDKIDIKGKWGVTTALVTNVEKVNRRDALQIILKILKKTNDDDEEEANVSNAHTQESASTTAKAEGKKEEAAVKGIQGIDNKDLKTLLNYINMYKTSIITSYKKLIKGEAKDINGLDAFNSTDSTIMIDEDNIKKLFQNILFLKIYKLFSEFKDISAIEIISNIQIEKAGDEGNGRLTQTRGSLGEKVSNLLIANQQGWNQGTSQVVQDLLEVEEGGEGNGQLTQTRGSLRDKVTIPLIANQQGRKQGTYQVVQDLLEVEEGGEGNGQLTQTRGSLRDKVKIPLIANQQGRKQGTYQVVQDLLEVEEGGEGNGRLTQTRGSLGDKVSIPLIANQQGRKQGTSQVVQDAPLFQKGRNQAVNKDDEAPPILLLQNDAQPANAFNMTKPIIYDKKKTIREFKNIKKLLINTDEFKRILEYSAILSEVNTDENDVINIIYNIFWKTYNEAIIYFKGDDNIDEIRDFILYLSIENIEKIHQSNIDKIKSLSMTDTEKKKKMIQYVDDAKKLSLTYNDKFKVILENHLKFLETYTEDESEDNEAESKQLDGRNIANAINEKITDNNDDNPYNILKKQLEKLSNDDLFHIMVKEKLNLIYFNKIETITMLLITRTSTKQNFEEFFSSVNDKNISDEGEKYIKEIIEKNQITSEESDWLVNLFRYSEDEIIKLFGKKGTFRIEIDGYINRLFHINSVPNRQFDINSLKIIDESNEEKKRIAELLKSTYNKNITDISKDINAVISNYPKQEKYMEKVRNLFDKIISLAFNILNNKDLNYAERNILIIENYYNNYAKIVFDTMIGDVESKISDSRTPQFAIKAAIIELIKKLKNKFVNFSIEVCFNELDALFKDNEINKKIWAGGGRQARKSPRKEPITKTSKAKKPTKTPKQKEPKAKDPKPNEPTKTPKIKEPTKTPKQKEPKAKDPKANEPITKTPKIKEPTKDPKQKKPTKTPKIKEPTKTPKQKEPTKTPKAKEPKPTKK
jgi:hypothetical protein